MNVYSVEYSAGWGGTWLTWFINQHLGVNIPIEFNPQERDYLLDDPSPIVWYYETQTFSELTSQHASDFAYKISPHHNWYEPPTAIPENNTTKRFIPYIHETLLDEFVDRRIVQIDRAEGMESTKLNEFYQRDPREFVLGFVHEPMDYIAEHCVDERIIPIDMGKLVAGEPSELARITDNINTAPLPNAVELLDNYRNTALKP